MLFPPELYIDTRDVNCSSHAGLYVLISEQSLQLHSGVFISINIASGMLRGKKGELPFFKLSRHSQNTHPDGF